MDVNTEIREEAVRELERYGIKGSYLYLIDIIPLIEMIWADGKAQESEIEILYKYLDEHLEKINKTAGIEVIDKDKANRFAEQFIKKRPSEELLATIRNLYFKILSTSHNESFIQEIKNSLFAACLDIGASSVLAYPYPPGERFNANEKKCFFEILSKQF